MINRLTKIQLIFFAIITLLGGAYVGGKYAQIDRLVVDRTYPVTAKFSDSGGIFAGAQVTYRGIEVGKVGKLTFTDSGVDVRLDIEKSAPRISADTKAVVANKSAIGEQFVDLQPRSRQAPYLAKGSVIERSNTAIPLSTTTLLLNLNSLVTSINTRDLKTLVDELGAAFEGTGPDLARILDTSSEFITAAQDNIGVTRELIRNSRGVLQTQIDKQGDLATFSDNLAKLSDTLRDADPDLRRLLDEGPSSARTIDAVVRENRKDLTSVLADLDTASAPLARNNKSLAVLGILYPYLLEGSYSVALPSKSDKGEYDATFGLVITPEPKTCSFANDGAASGYRERRSPADLSDRAFDVNSDCKVESKVARNPSKTEINRDRATASSSSPGKDTWQWLLLGPAAQ
ncbi:MAG: MlaD family protein [Aeromicrobium erythreum]